MQEQTYPTVAEIIRGQMESLEPQTAVVAFLQRHDGKQLGKRLLERLNAEIPGHEFRLRQVAGMTNLEWGGYGRNCDARPGGSLLCAYRTKNLTVDVAFIRQHNVAYFEATLQRNSRRELALKDEQLLQNVDAWAAQFRLLRSYLNAVLDDFPGPLYPDNIAIRKALDLVKEK